ERRPPAALHADERHPRRRYRTAREHRRAPERDAQAAGDALHVAPHVAPPQRVDHERRRIHAARGEDRTEEERRPADADAARRGDRVDPHGREVGVRARELAPEVDLRHAPPPRAPASPRAAPPTLLATAAPPAPRTST